MRERAQVVSCPESELQVFAAMKQCGKEFLIAVTKSNSLSKSHFPNVLQRALYRLIHLNDDFREQKGEKGI